MRLLQLVQSRYEHVRPVLILEKNRKVVFWMFKIFIKVVAGGLFLQLFEDIWDLHAFSV